MKRMRIMLALLMTLTMLLGITSSAWADDYTVDNGVITPVVYTSPESYDGYTVFDFTISRTTGQSLAQSFDFTVEANAALLTIHNEGIPELDIAINGQRLNVNTFFEQATGDVSLDLSGLVHWGTNTVSVQALGTPGQSATVSIKAPAFNTRILHINDMHANIAPLAKVSAYVQAARAQGGNVFFVDAGDNFSGNPVADLNKGVPVIQVLNAIGTDVFAVGNHDFDYGPAETAARRSESTFPWLSANTQVVDQSATPITPFEPYQIFTNDLGQKIAFIALTQTPPATGAKNTVGLVFNDPLAAAQRYVDELRDQVNLVVLVSHNGLDYDAATLAPALTGVDLIIGAHSHSYLSKPTVVNNIPIVQTGSGLANLGDLILRQAEAVSIKGGTASGAYNAATKYMVDADSTVQAIIDDWNALMDPILDTEIGSTTVALTGGDKTSQDVNIGNVITDAMRSNMNSDMAIWNNGGIRADINAGPITMREVYSVLPFGNFIWKAELTGQQMVDMLKRSFNKYKNIDLQISGASYVVSAAPDGTIVDLAIKVNGAPIDLNRTYTLALSDYIATSKAYFPDGSPTILDMGQVDALVVADFIKQVGTLNYLGSEGRIQVKTVTVPVAVSSLNFYNSSSLVAAGADGSLVPLTDQATVLVTGEATAYQVDRSTTVPKNFVMVDAGQPIPLVAMQSVGSGKVVASGAMLVANGYRTYYQNPQYFTNLLDYLTGSNSGAVLFDQGHGQYYDVSRLTSISAFISERGYTANFTAKSSALTADTLAGTDVLVISTPGTYGTYTADELAAISDFLARGGSLILLSQTDYNNNSYPTMLNQIAAGVGSVLRFNSDEVRDDTSKDGTANYSPVTDEFNTSYPELLKVR